MIASSPAPAIRPTRRGDLPSLSGTLIRPLLSLHTHWIPATKGHPIPGHWRHWRLVTLTFLVTRCCCLMQYSPAPVVPVPPGGAPLDQLLHDLSVGAGGRQVKRGLVWGPCSGDIVSIFPKLELTLIEITWSRGWPRPQAGPEPGQADPETPPGGAGSESGRHARPGASHPVQQGSPIQ